MLRGRQSRLGLIRDLSVDISLVGVWGGGEGKGTCSTDDEDLHGCVLWKVFNS